VAFFDGFGDHGGGNGAAGGISGGGGTAAAAQSSHAVRGLSGGRVPVRFPRLQAGRRNEVCFSPLQAKAARVCAVWHTVAVI
jgi:hypothetical protein